MTVSNPYAARFDEIARRYYDQDEGSSENAERVERAGIEAGRWFDGATKPQRVAYNEASARWAGDYSPRANRAREAAKAAFYASTGDAAELCLRAFEDFLRDGEIRPDIAEAFEALAAPNAHVAEPFRTILNTFAGAA